MKIGKKLSEQMTTMSVEDKDTGIDKLCHKKALLQTPEMCILVRTA